MKPKEILIVGAGIAGCAIALALAKRGIPVSVLTSSFDQRAYHSPFIQHDRLEEKIRELQQTKLDQQSCSRAYEQLAQTARKSVDELLEMHYLVDRNGNIDIHRCLQEQLKQFEHVEWISHYSVVELLTLENHSPKKADRYKKSTCFGVMAYNHETHQIETILAKETILATGGAASLYPYSTHPQTACGQGLAIAHRAGARLLNMEMIQFHPLGLFEKDRPCFPLPLELLSEGGQLHLPKLPAIEIPHSSHELTLQLYDLLLITRADHLWLDLTQLDPTEMKEKFPTVDAYCLTHGFNIAKDPLPIVPVAFYSCGGIAVDRVGQTNLQRLRAIGEISCTGLFSASKEEALGVLESLTWALACSEDIAKQIDKLVYYFPAIRQEYRPVNSNSEVVEEDWKILREVMWSYGGIRHERKRLERGCALLEELHRMNAVEDICECSIEQNQLLGAIQTALLVVRSALVQQPYGQPRKLTEKIGMDISELKNRIETVTIG